MSAAHWVAHLLTFPLLTLAGEADMERCSPGGGRMSLALTQRASEDV